MTPVHTYICSIYMYSLFRFGVSSSSSGGSLETHVWVVAPHSCFLCLANTHPQTWTRSLDLSVLTAEYVVSKTVRAKAIRWLYEQVKEKLPGECFSVVPLWMQSLYSLCCGFFHSHNFFSHSEPFIFVGCFLWDITLRQMSISIFTWSLIFHFLASLLQRCSGDWGVP